MPNLAAQKRFARFAWCVLAFNLPVILWGAFVRVSYSGDGCGAHWPFCNGQAVPRNMTKPTLIEFAHRMTTGLDAFLMVALVALAFWLYPKRHIIRRCAVASLVFLFIEAMLGAGLVLFRLVARSQSSGRVWYLSAHLTNTMLMLAAMTLTAWFASAALTEDVNGLSKQRVRPGMIWAAIVTIFISITGAVTALGDTLFPADSLLQGVRQDLASDSPLLLRLRVAHPAIALLGTAFVLWMVLDFWRSSSSGIARKAAIRVCLLACLQLFVGAANLSLLAPVWMQILHLFLGDVLWIALVLVVAESVRSGRQLAPTLAVPELGRQTAASKPA